MENITNSDTARESDDPRIWGGIASCKGQPPELWFADNYNSLQGREATRIAKKICSVCPVKKKCLQLANDSGEAFGIWGGLTPKERGFKRMTKQF